MPGHPQTLKPYTKGDPRAVAGGKKSKRKSFDKRMQEWLESKIKAKIENSTEEITVEEAMRQILFREANKGNVNAIKEVFDRAYGKSRQVIALGQDEDAAPVGVNISDIRAKQISERITKKLAPKTAKAKK